VSFPEDFPDENRRGQKQRLRLELKEARQKVLPEIDDAFAAGLGEFADLAALRQRVQEDLQEDAERRAEGDIRRQLIEQILEANPFEAPGSMIERYLDYMLGEGDDAPEGRRRKQRSPEEEARFAEVRESLRPQAEAGLKRTLAVERLAEQEGLRATQDEIDDRVETLAEKHGRSPSEVWIQLEKSGQLEALEREITEDKVFDYLKAQNTVA
jgi:trigger factor